MEPTKEINIDLGRILFMMRKRAVLIVLITMLGGVLAGCFTEVFIKPTYTASCSMFVNSNTSRVSSDSSISESELSASQELVNTYLVIIKSETVLQKVKSELGLDLSIGQINSMISASKIQDTIAFQVSVTSSDANLSAKVANAVADVAPDEIVRIVKAGSVEVIDYAKVPGGPSGPNLPKNIIIGLAIGLVLSFAFFFVKELFDTTITNERDLQREFDIPVLGTIPRITVGTSDQNSDSKKKGA